jgi:hypothetical protein
VSLHLLTAEHRAELARIAALRADFEAARLRFEAAGGLVAQHMQFHAARHGLMPEDGRGFSSATSWKLGSLRTLYLQRHQQITAAYAIFLGVDGTGTPVDETRTAYTWRSDPAFDSFLEELRPALERWGPIERIEAMNSEVFESELREKLAGFVRGA